MERPAHLPRRGPRRLHARRLAPAEHEPDHGERRIEALEHVLDVALFTRSTRGFALTPQGQALLARIEEVEVAAIDVETEATRLIRDLSGSIRVTAPEAIMSLVVGPTMLHFRALHPEVRFESLSSETRVNMEKGEADIAFRATDAPLEGDALIALRLPDVKWGVFGSDADLEKHGKPDRMEALQDHAILAFSGMVATLHFSICFLSYVRGEQVVTTCNSIPNMAGAVRSGLGVGLLPLMTGVTTPGLVLCFPPPVETDSKWYILAPPDAYRQPRIRSFMAFAAERIRHDKSGWLRT